MHYGESSVSINKKQPAMLPLEYDYKYTLGSPFVSFVDLVMVNKLYECDVSVSEPRPTSRTVKPFPTTTQTPLPDSFWIYGEAASQCVDHPK
ncbi:hypothetical protein OSTOST_21934 [Ostertagia ostertagi]